MKAKRTVLTAVGLCILSAYGILVYLRIPPKSLRQLVSELGTPSFFAENMQLRKAGVKQLALLVNDSDPESVVNWEAIVNANVIWAKSESCKRSARFFYRSMKIDKSFDGGGWYSARSLFGEKLIIVKIDSAGKVVGYKTERVDAVSFKLKGFESVTQKSPK